MSKKFFLGIPFALLVAAFWACGDGSIDSPSDRELMIVGKFDSELSDNAIDSMVALCNARPECKKAMDWAYKNDKNIHNITDSSLITDEDDTIPIHSGNALPSYSFSSDASSSSAPEEEESSSSRVASSSSRKVSSSSADEPVYVISSSSSVKEGDGPHKQEYSSDSKIEYSSVSFSSSSVAQSSSSYATLPSSSSKKGNSSSSIRPASSVSANCTLPVEGTCKPDKIEVERLENVTWTFVPKTGSRTDGEIEWNSFDTDASVSTQKGSFTFTTSFSEKGDKKQTEFAMDAEACGFGDNINIVSCDPVTVVPKVLKGCQCKLGGFTATAGKVSLDLVAHNGGIARDFKWSVSGCNAEAKDLKFAWNMGSSTTSSLTMKLEKPKSYQPAVTVSLMDGSEVESKLDVTCDMLVLKNDLLPMEVDELNKSFVVTSGDRIQIAGAAKSSGSNLRCWRYDGSWQSGACSVSFESGSTVSASMSNCQSNDGWQNVSYALSNLDSEGIVTITMSGVDEGKSKQLQCKVVQ